MAWVTPSARAAGYTITDTDWNQDVKDNTIYLKGVVDGTALLAIARRAANQSIPNATWTPISLDTEDEDGGGFIDIAGNAKRITFPRAGHYRINAEVTFDTNATGIRGIQLRREESSDALIDTTFLLTSIGAAESTTARLSFLTASKAAASWYELNAYQNCSSDLNAIARIDIQLEKDET